MMWNSFEIFSPT